jgi:hypothetical protein
MAHKSDIGHAVQVRRRKVSTGAETAREIVNLPAGQAAAKRDVPADRPQQARPRQAGSQVTGA